MSWLSLASCDVENPALLISLLHFGGPSLGISVFVIHVCHSSSHILVMHVGCFKSGVFLRLSTQTADTRVGFETWRSQKLETALDAGDAFACLRRQTIPPIRFPPRVSSLPTLWANLLQADCFHAPSASFMSAVALESSAVQWRFFKESKHCNRCHCQAGSGDFGHLAFQRFRVLLESLDEILHPA